MKPIQRFIFISWSIVVALIGGAIAVIGVFTTPLDFWIGMAWVAAGLLIIIYTTYAARITKVDGNGS